MQHVLGLLLVQRLEHVAVEEAGDVAGRLTARSGGRRHGGADAGDGGEMKRAASGTTFSWALVIQITKI